MKAYFQDIRLTTHSLIKMTVAILLGFFITALVGSWALADRNLIRRAHWIYSQQGRRAGEEFLHEVLSRHVENREAWLLLVRLRSEVVIGRPFEPEDLDPFLTDAEFDLFLDRSSQIQPEILRAWWDWGRGDEERALRRLHALPEDSEVLLAAAGICAESDQTEKAIQYWTRLLALEPENPEATDGLLQGLLSLGDEARFRELLADPGVDSRLDPEIPYRFYLSKREYLAALPYLYRDQLAHYSWALIVACLAVGLCWVALCLHIGGGWDWQPRTQVMAGVALLLGIASALACLAVVVVMDHEMVLRGRGMFSSLILSLIIGVREELIKLLFLLPLVPFLARNRNHLQIISIASLVGLGFAMEENANYYLASSGSGVVGRFLTANFFHLTLTGYCGYYLVRAVQIGGEAWHTFLTELSKMILFHAAYDFFLIEPSLAEYSIFSSILFIWLSQQYLRLVLSMKLPRGRRVSLTRVFVACLAIATGIHYLFLSDVYGVMEAIWITGSNVFGVIIIAFMFFHEFDERVA
ncbi:MAG: PrsW family glutamic-type intramembrane protease [Planctomycetota bacterium]